jgi:lipoyl(octanoyl) transferase
VSPTKTVIVSLQVRRLGVVPYAEGLALQQELVAARKADRIPDQLLLLEHPPVITLGAKVRDDRSHVLASRRVEVATSRITGRASW